MEFKYHEVARQAMEFAYAHEGRLPSERELCDLCGTSRITAKKALNDLRERGLVTRHVGRGTFLANGVTPPKFRVLMVTANMPPSLREAMREEAALFGSEAGIGRIECVGIGERVVRAIQGPGAKLVIWPYSARLADTGALAALDQMPGFDEVAGAAFRDLADRVPDAEARPYCAALPFALSCDVFAYNKTLAAQLGLDAARGPRSWDEILQWARRGAEQLGRPATVCIEGVRPVVPVSYYLAASGGKDFLNLSGDVPAFDFRGGLRWLQFFQQLLQPELAEGVRPDRPDPFSTGKALFRYDAGAWLLDAVPPAATEFVTMPLPPMEQGGRRFSLVQKNCLAIVPGGDREGAEAAWAFCRHLLSAGVQRRLWSKVSLLSPNAAVFEEQEADPRWKAFASGVRSGIDLPTHPVRFGFNTLMREAMEDVVKRGAVPEEVARKTVEFGKLLLRVEAERTWY